MYKKNIFFPLFKMDYSTQYQEVLDVYSLIPAWFYSLSTQDRTTIFSTSLAQYISDSTAKDNLFAAWFTTYIEAFNPN